MLISTTNEIPSYSFSLYVLSRTQCISYLRPLIVVVPLVEGEAEVGSDGEEGGVGQLGIGVRREMDDGRVGDKLHHHAKIVLRRIEDLRALKL